MRRDPFVKQGKSELALGQCFHHKPEGSVGRNIQIESVHQEKCVRGRKPHPLVAVHKAVIIDQRLQQRRRLLAKVVVVPRLRTENRGFQRALIQQPVFAAVFLNLLMVDRDHFSHGQVDALRRHLASRLYNSRYFSFERR
jgi:hypothetical protein